MKLLTLTLLTLALTLVHAEGMKYGLLYSYASDDECTGTPFAIDIIPNPTPSQCINSTCWGGDNGAQPWRKQVCTPIPPSTADYPISIANFKTPDCSGTPWVTVVASEGCVKDGDTFIRSTCNATATTFYAGCSSSCDPSSCSQKEVTTYTCQPVPNNPKESFLYSCHH